MNGSVYTLKAEFEAARNFAMEIGVPIRDVLQLVEEQAWEEVRTKKSGKDRSE
jgi:uncharacterized protein (DUF111 family)